MVSTRPSTYLFFEHWVRCQLVVVLFFRTRVRGAFVLLLFWGGSRIRCPLLLVQQMCVVCAAHGWHCFLTGAPNPIPLGADGKPSPRPSGAYGLVVQPFREMAAVPCHSCSGADWAPWPKLLGNRWAPNAMSSPIGGLGRTPSVGSTGCLCNVRFGLTLFVCQLTLYLGLGRKPNYHHTIVP